MLLGDRIGRRLKLQDLNVFMAVVQAGSMGKAAERLNTVQPAVSRSIRELEHTFGVRLLDRHRHGIEPTEFGSALLNCGLTVFDDLRQGVKAIESLADPTAGEVRIGCSATLAASLVTAVVDRLSRRHPRMVFQLVAMPTGSSILKAGWSTQGGTLPWRRASSSGSNSFVRHQVESCPESCRSTGVAASVKNREKARSRTAVSGT